MIKNRAGYFTRPWIPVLVERFYPFFLVAATKGHVPLGFEIGDAEVLGQKFDVIAGIVDAHVDYLIGLACGIAARSCLAVSRLGMSSFRTMNIRCIGTVRVSGTYIVAAPMVFNAVPNLVRSSLLMADSFLYDLE